MKNTFSRTFYFTVMMACMCVNLAKAQTEKEQKITMDSLYIEEIQEQKGLSQIPVSV